MATPKIKIYRLDRGYSESADNDIQAQVNDELLPIVDKNIIPDDAYYLYGVTGGAVLGDPLSQTLKPIGVQTVEALSNPGSEVQSGSVGNWIIDGYYTPVIKHDTGVAFSASEYTINAETGAVTFLNTPYETGVTAEYYAVPAVPVNTFYAASFPIYGRANYNFVERVYADDVFIPKADYTIDYAKGLVTFDVAFLPTVVVMDAYVLNTSAAKIFVSDHPNWVYGHMRTNPDIFKGVENYDGDDSIDNLGNIVTQGAIPKFIDSGFSVDYRAGVVTFSANVDSVATPVRANYAYYLGINNVTAQELTLDAGYVGGYKYKAIDEEYFPDSHGKRWVTRNNYLMPRNFYDGEESLPKTISVNPYAVLEAKGIGTVANGETYTVTDFKLKTYIRFTGTTGQTGNVSINGNTFTFGNTTGSVVWQGTTKSLGDIITETSGDYTFKVQVYDGLVISVYDFAK